MVEHYNKRIQNIIQKELFKAKDSIKIAVAWFTNDLLFQPLLLKLQTGVSVELVLNKDKINDSEDNDIDFSEFVENGGVLHWNDSKRLMHEKFCIIDDETVIYGSYNWTNKAELNDESIAVSKGEQSTTDFYLTSFEKLCKQYPADVVVERKFHIRDTFYASAETLFEINGVKILKKKNEDNGKDIYRLYNAETCLQLTSYDFDNILFRPDTETTTLAVKKGAEWFFFNLKDKYLISDVIYEDISFINNYDLYWIKQNGLWGIGKFDGSLLLPCQFSDLSIRNRKYIILGENGKYGLFDWNDYIWDCTCDSIELLSGDFFKIKKNGEFFIARRKDIVVRGDFDGIEHIKNSQYIVSKGDAYGIVDNGNIILMNIYDKITFIGSDMYDTYLLQKGDKYGLFINGEEVVTSDVGSTCEFDEVKLWRKNNDVSYWRVKMEGLYGLIEGDHFKYDCMFEELPIPPEKWYQPIVVPVKFVGEYGLFDDKGNVIVDFKYKQISLIDSL